MRPPWMARLALASSMHLQSMHHSMMGRWGGTHAHTLIAAQRLPPARLLGRGGLMLQPHGWRLQAATTAAGK